jgi:hypothetical protein
MTLALILTAIRRHPFGIFATGLLIVAMASMLAVSVPLAVGVWAVAAIVIFELWYGLEPFILRRFGGCRPPSHAECELLEGVVGGRQLQPLTAVQPGITLVRGMRCLVIGRDVLELFEERALAGLLYQAAAPVHRADLAGVAMVWLGSLPVLGCWLITRACGVLGRLLGVVVGEGLVLPLVVWRDGFLRWSARVFGSIVVGLLGAMLLSDGFAAPGLGLMIAWLVVPAVNALLAWESRRVERAADQATVDAGFGSQLLEALELLIVADQRPGQSGLLGLLQRPGEPLVTRANRIRQTLARS